MYKFLFIGICLLEVIQMNLSHGQLRRCTQLYCKEDTGNTLSIALQQSQVFTRSGKPGPMGPPGIVNYTRIEGNLKKKYEEFDAEIARKMKEFESRIDKHMARNYEMINKRMDQQIKVFEAKMEEKMKTMLKEILKGNPAPNQSPSIVPTDKSTNKPHGCEDICQKINDGDMINQPIGFATKGNQAKIFPEGFPNGLEVYCDCSSGNIGEAWTVFQRRKDGSQDFYQNWQSYVNGFGSKTGEFWLGLDALSKIASNPNEFELRIDLMDWEEEKRFAEYRSFSIGDASTSYKLTVAGYSGNAGDGLVDNDSWGVHNQMPFTTMDKDNDKDHQGNCAMSWHGAWWYNNCFYSHLNGKYYRENENRNWMQGIIWYDWKQEYSLKAVEMKFRKKN